MTRTKRLLRALLFPPMLIPLLLTPLSAIALSAVFITGHTAHPLAYAAYTLSFYTLLVISLRIPDIYRWWQRLLEKNPLLHRLTTDARFRLRVILHTSLFVNTSYALFQLSMGLLYRSRWFYALAAYYALLTVMRYYLLRDLKQLTPGEDYAEELHRYRFCGIALAAMTPALLVIVAFIVWQDRGFSYHSITTIAIAAYTFSAFTVAVVNIIKYRKYNSPLLSAAKAVSLTTASVSMLSLETAMLSAFGNESDAVLRQLITAISGVAVCVFVLGMAVFMITHAAKELKILSPKGDQHGTP
ncbi:MAG: hypothetical protein E7639_02685 [Ruminococcaceae bacterium]|nr:hypothetical protein [Oscillospiraceae bacterium]